MKAWVLNEIGNIAFSDINKPVIKDDEVLVKVMAAGVCGSDIPRVYETGAHKMPLVCGHEFSGIVDDVKDEADQCLKGRRVGIYPLIPCEKCAPCKSGHPEMCRNYDYLGSRRDGGFAEYVSVPRKNLIELPDEVSYEQAAMLEPMAVAVHAMRRATDMMADGLSSESKVIVCGLGTIGMLVTMFLKEYGFSEIYVIGNKDSQRERVGRLGIALDHFCDIRRDEVLSWIDRHAGNADVFFECVGKNECVSYGVDSVGPGGRIVLVGNPYSDMSLSKEKYWKILRNQLIITGTWNSTFVGEPSGRSGSDDWQYVLEKLVEGAIHPEEFITHKLQLEELEKGLIIMRDKSEEYGKVMVTAGDEAYGHLSESGE